MQPGLRPLRGTAAQILGLLRAWDTAPTAPPLVVETSGSTAEPKRVALSRAAMRASADATHRRLGGPGRWVLTLPPTYVAGLQVLFRSVRARTEPLVADGHLGDAADALTAERCYVSLVPTQLHRALDDGHRAQSLARFDAVLVGGAALDAGLRAEAESVGARIVATYGMSETCGGCVYDGRPLDGVEVSTAPDGRVRLRGPVLFDGYDGRPDLTAEVLADGWLTTSDRGHLDRAGRLVIEGRVDDVVVSGGVNVPTETVAAVLRRDPRVRDVEVVGVPDAEWGQVVVAVAVTEADLTTLRDVVGAALPRSFAPRRLVPVAALPRLANGKTDRVAVQRLARTAGTAGAA